MREKGKISPLLTRAEEIVLLAVRQLNDQAYGVMIRGFVSEATGYAWSIGALYAPLYRLERKGFVRAQAGEPTPARGGRRKVYYSLTPDGAQALMLIQRVQSALWAKLKPLPTDVT
jgi:DNA-binding PadR family transcriptional regulator